MTKLSPAFFSEFLTLPKSAAVILAASAGALIFVFVAQFGFHYDPCVLCWWQRGPYAATLLLSLICFFWKPYARHSRVLLALCGAAFLIGAGLAIFHSGVELHWWLGTSGCSVQPLHGHSPEDLRKQLLAMAVPHCDQISWTFLGFSMANWNVPASLVLAVFSFLAAKPKTRSTASYQQKSL
jgi:disulfide bond formation protein DsbB